MLESVKIVFENSDFWAVEKPALWLTVPGRAGSQDPRPVLRHVFEKQVKTPVYAVHRLDFEVSGLVLFAKNAVAHRLASQAFENHEAQKVYWARTERNEGRDAEVGQEFVWDFHLVRGKKRSFEAPHGKRAITNAVVVKDDGTLLDWQLRPLTGRSHQLRLSLSRAGFPIIGDQLYGAQTPYDREGIALRAIALTIPALRMDIRLAPTLSQKARP